MRTISRRVLWLAPFCFVLCFAVPAFAQHTDHEFAFSFAKGGQGKLERITFENHGFYQNVTLWNFRAMLITNGVQSLSFFVEHVDETRSYETLITRFVNRTFSATVDESMPMTTLGFETIRTLLSYRGFRLGGGIGLGWGFGTPKRVVRPAENFANYSEEGCHLWNAFYLTALMRARYTIYSNEYVDVGLTLTGRYWGFPSIAPTGECGPQDYNGPDMRTAHQIGYLAGISVGF